jgi:hypothetical protein
MQFRPVFQDPTNGTNTNAPQPQALPFSWNFPGECDEAVVVLSFDSAAWDGFDFQGADEVQIVLQVMVEYNGQWWDADAFKLAMGQVQVTPPGSPVEFFG